MKLFHLCLSSFSDTISVTSHESVSFVSCTFADTLLNGMVHYIENIETSYCFFFNVNPQIFNFSFYIDISSLLCIHLNL